MPNELLGRYRHLRAISAPPKAALKFLARFTILEHARHLRADQGRVLVADSEGK